MVKAVVGSPDLKNAATVLAEGLFYLIPRLGDQRLNTFSASNQEHLTLLSQLILNRKPVPTETMASLLTQMQVTLEGTTFSSSILKVLMVALDDGASLGISEKQVESYLLLPETKGEFYQPSIRAQLKEEYAKIEKAPYLKAPIESLARYIVYFENLLLAPKPESKGPAIESKESAQQLNSDPVKATLDFLAQSLSSQVTCETGKEEFYGSLTTQLALSLAKKGSPEEARFQVIFKTTIHLRTLVKEILKECSVPDTGVSDVHSVRELVQAVFAVRKDPPLGDEKYVGAFKEQIWAQKDSFESRLQKKMAHFLGVLVAQCQDQFNGVGSVGGFQSRYQGLITLFCGIYDITDEKLCFEHNTMQNWKAFSKDVLSERPQTGPILERVAMHAVMQPDSAKLDLSVWKMAMETFGTPSLLSMIAKVGTAENFQKFWNELDTAGKRQALDTPDARGLTLMMYVVWGGSMPMLECIEADFPGELRNFVARLQEDPITQVQITQLLHSAARSKNEKMMESVLTALKGSLTETQVKEQLLAKDADGLNTVMQVALSGNMATLALILHEWPQRQWANVLNQTNNAGQTALLLAAHNGDVSMVSELIKRGANSLFRVRSTCWGVLHMAYAGGHEKSAKTLRVQFPKLLENEVHGLAACFPEALKNTLLDLVSADPFESRAPFDGAVILLKNKVQGWLVAQRLAAQSSSVFTDLLVGFYTQSSNTTEAEPCLDVMKSLLALENSNGSTVLETWVRVNPKGMADLFVEMDTHERRFRGSHFSLIERPTKLFNGSINLLKRMIMRDKASFLRMLLELRKTRPLAVYAFLEHQVRGVSFVEFVAEIVPNTLGHILGALVKQDPRCITIVFSVKKQRSRYSVLVSTFTCVQNDSALTKAMLNAKVNDATTVAQTLAETEPELFTKLAVNLAKTELGWVKAVLHKSIAPFNQTIANAFRGDHPLLLKEIKTAVALARAALTEETKTTIPAIQNLYEMHPDEELPWVHYLALKQPEVLKTLLTEHLAKDVDWVEHCLTYVWYQKTALKTMTLEAPDVVKDIVMAMCKRDPKHIFMVIDLKVEIKMKTLLRDILWKLVATNPDLVKNMLNTHGGYGYSVMNALIVQHAELFTDLVIELAKTDPAWVKEALDQRIDYGVYFTPARDALKAQNPEGFKKLQQALGKSSWCLVS